jgi:hypothetical protein
MSISFAGTDQNRPHPRLEGRYASVWLDVNDPRGVNWCNGNAVILLDLLGLEGDENGSLYGEVTVADARRAILRARATLDRRGPALERAPTVSYGAPRLADDGTIELRPIRSWSSGLDVAGMRTRVDAFERCVNALVERGATHITWG